MSNNRSGFLFLVTALFGFVLLSLQGASAQTTHNRDNLFQNHGTSGTFVLRNLKTGQTTIINPERARRQLIPASTFKIANSIIALEEKVVADEHEVIPYGGQPQPFKSWEQDMSLRQAIKISNVPVFQELARRLGLDAYLQWLMKFKYGNAQVGKNVETFWLEGPLATSAIEQVEFLEKLLTGNLPVSSNTTSIVKRILLLENTSTYELYGKTGWTITPSPNIGWFVGWVATKDGQQIFALNMDIKARRDAKLRKLIAMKLLENLNVIVKSK